MEMKELQNYLKDYKIEDVVLELVESALKDKPADPKTYWREKLKAELGDNVEQDATTDATKAEHRKSKSNAIMEVPGHHLLKLFEVTRNINAEIVPQETIKVVISETLKLLACDRVSLFVFDKRINMLVLNASNLEQPIRVNAGQGIAGTVFSSQETVNIPDCYTDDRFDPGFDKMTGYKTKSLLCMPITDFENETMGVLQAINKEEEGEFNQIDELLMGHLAQHVAIALRNADVYKDAIIASERANGLLMMIQSLSQDLGTQSMILTITMHANQLVQADRCTVFLVDEAKQQLWSVSTDSGKEIRIPKTAGLAGECATEVSLINIPDAYEDQRFNQAIDKKTGYRTKSVLVVPVQNEHQTKILAVIQMINKSEFDGEIGVFDEEDVQIMETFAQFVGTRLSSSSLLSHSGGDAKKSEVAAAFGEVEHGGSHHHGHSGAGRKSMTEGNQIIEEGEEEEG
jgi:adenylate cyclase